MLFLRRAHSPFIKNILRNKTKQQQRYEHRIRKNKQIKSTVHDGNKKNEINNLCVNKQRQSMKIKNICRNQWQKRSIIQTNSIS